MSDALTDISCDSLRGELGAQMIYYMVEYLNGDSKARYKAFQVAKEMAAVPKGYWGVKDDKTKTLMAWLKELKKGSLEAWKRFVVYSTNFMWGMTGNKGFIPYEIVKKISPWRDKKLGILDTHGRISHLDIEDVSRLLITNEHKYARLVEVEVKPIGEAW